MAAAHVQAGHEHQRGEREEQAERHQRLRAELPPGNPDHRPILASSASGAGRPMYASTMSSRLTSATVHPGSMIGSSVRTNSVLWRSVCVSSITSWLAGSRE